jgi:hypothetical protein
MMFGFRKTEMVRDRRLRERGGAGGTEKCCEDSATEY